MQKTPNLGLVKPSQEDHYNIDEFNTNADRLDNVIQGRDNYIINGNFDIWQRGWQQTTFAYGSDDRWINVGVPTPGATHSRQSFDVGQTEVPNNPRFFSRTTFTQVPANDFNRAKIQRIEDVRTLAGEAATLSFWAKADSNRAVEVMFTQGFGTGGSALVVFGNTLIYLTPNWQKFIVTIDVPSIAGRTIGANSYLSVNFAYSRPIAPQSGTFDIAQVKLEKGNIATPFVPNFPFVELMMCMRYYESASFSRSLANLLVGNTMRTVVDIPFFVQKRVNPSMTRIGNITNSLSGADMGAFTFGFADTRRIGRIDFTVTTPVNGMPVQFNWAADAEL